MTGRPNNHFFSLTGFGVPLPRGVWRHTGLKSAVTSAVGSIFCSFLPRKGVAGFPWRPLAGLLARCAVRVRQVKFDVHFGWLSGCAGGWPGFSPIFLGDPRLAICPHWGSSASKGFRLPLDVTASKVIQLYSHLRRDSPLYPFHLGFAEPGECASCDH